MSIEYVLYDLECKPLNNGTPVVLPTDDMLRAVLMLYGSHNLVLLNTSPSGAWVTLGRPDGLRAVLTAQ